MKTGKTPGPSGIMVEMIRAAGDMGASMIHDLAAVINRDGKVPSDWKQSFTVCLYKGKGDVLERCNYRYPSEQVTKSFLFVLRFYGPVNPMGSCRAWSVYLTTHLLGRLSPLSG